MYKYIDWVFDIYEHLQCQIIERCKRDRATASFIQQQTTRDKYLISNLYVHAQSSSAWDLGRKSKFLQSTTTARSTESLKDQLTKVRMQV